MSNFTKIISVILVSILATGSLAQAADPPPSELETAVYELALDLVKEMEGKNTKKVAVVDFTDLNGYQSALGDFISEELITSLYRAGSGKLDVIERRELARVLKEQKLGASGMFDPDTIAKIGNLLGINAVITGTITYLGNSIKINSRIIAVDTAKTMGASAKKIANDSVIENLAKQSAKPSLGEGATGERTIQSAQRHDVHWSDDRFLVTPEFLKKQDDNKFVLGLRIQNIKNATQYLAIGNIYNDDVTLVGNNGDVHRSPRVTGIPRSNMSVKREDFLELLPGQSVIVTFSYSGNVKNGVSYSFSIDVAYLLADKAKLRNVRISGIEAR